MGQWKSLGDRFANFMIKFFNVYFLLLFFARWPSSSFEFSDHSSTSTFIKHSYLTWCAFSISTIVQCDIIVFISIIVLACTFLDRSCNWSMLMPTKLSNCSYWHLLCLHENTNVSGVPIIGSAKILAANMVIFALSVIGSKYPKILIIAHVKNNY